MAAIKLDFFIGILILIFFIPTFSGKAKAAALRGIQVSFAAYLLLSVAGLYLRGDNWAYTWTWNNPQHLVIYSPMNNL